MIKDNVSISSVPVLSSVVIPSPFICAFVILVEIVKHSYVIKNAFCKVMQIFQDRYFVYFTTKVLSNIYKLHKC